MKSMMHNEFRGALVHFVENGTDDERALAEVALGLYDLFPEHPEVVSLVNRRALEAFNHAD